MLYGKENRDEAEFLEPIFGSESEQVDLPKYKLGENRLNLVSLINWFKMRC